MGEVFGPLAWNPDLAWWSGSAEVAPGHRVDLFIQAGNEPDALRAAVERAVPGWDRLRAVEPAVRVAVSEQMTDAHNALCDPEDEVTVEQFAGRLQLLSVLFESTGGVELSDHDRRLFGGHQLIVPISNDGDGGEAFEAG